MVRWRSVLVGALTFLGAHAILLAFWRSWFEPGGAHAAWFLNSGRGVAFTAVCLVSGSAFAAALARDSALRDRLAGGLAFAAGAMIAMASVLFAGDSGTIFPIVLVIGASVVLVSALAGAVAGGAVAAARAGR